MTVSLKDQACIVAGASSGIGRAVALGLAKEGARVLAVARRADELRKLEAGGLLTCSADLTLPADVERMAAEALKALGRIDLLVFAAGTNLKKRTMAELSLEDWEMMVRVNLTAAFACTKAVLPLMRAAGGGSIIYISSIAAHHFDPVSGASYQAAKAGLSGLAHATRLEEKKNGIRTCLVFPGLTRTDILQKRPAPTPPEILEKALEPEDVADAVLAVARLNPRAVVPELEVVPSRL